MKSWLEHPLRVTGRLLWLGGECMLAALGYAAHCAFRAGESNTPARAAWLRRHSRRVLRIFRLEPAVAGKIPSSGMLVCNHLSYLDVLVLAALSPCVFVAKREVKHWPVFGGFARLAGTVFADRKKRSQAAQAVDEIAAALRSGVLVVLFPEGTSSGGESVLPFKSALLEPAVRATHPLTAGFLRYELDDGDASEEVCYWKDMTLVPHLVNLLGKRAVRATVRLSSLRAGGADRKQLARQLHAEVLRLKHAVAVGNRTVEPRQPSTFNLQHPTPNCDVLP